MPYHTTIVHILKRNLFRFHLEYIFATSCETKIPMKIRTVSIIFWKKKARSYSSKRNSFLYSHRFSALEKNAVIFSQRTMLTAC
jgi:hypothetical protein